jgi:hypothetical protein
MVSGGERLRWSNGGRHLAEQGFAVAVPTLPSWANHARNGRAIQELIGCLAKAGYEIREKKLGALDL